MLTLVSFFQPKKARYMIPFANHIPLSWKVRLVLKLIIVFVSLGFTPNQTGKGHPMKLPIYFPTIPKVKNAYLKLVTLFLLSLMNLAAFAGGGGNSGLDAGQVGKNVGDQMSGLTQGVLYASAFVGVVLVVIGT